MGDTAKSQWKSNRASSSLTNSKPTRPKISPETVALLVESIQSNDVETTIDKHMRELRKALGYTDDELKELMETMTSKETTSDAAVKRLKSLGFDEEQIYTLQTATQHPPPQQSAGPASVFRNESQTNTSQYQPSPGGRPPMADMTRITRQSTEEQLGGRNREGSNSPQRKREDMILLPPTPKPANVKEDIEHEYSNVPPTVAKTLVPTTLPDCVWPNLSDRIQTEALLRATGKNSYLVRKASQPGCYSLSMCTISTGKYSHILIEPFGNKQYILKHEKSIVYANLFVLVEDIAKEYPTYTAVRQNSA